MNLISILIFTSLLLGCSTITQKIESLTQNSTDTTAIISNKINYCPVTSKLQYISEDEHSLKFYKSLHPSLFENKQLSFIEKSVMLSLLEMSRRPDEATPNSRLQVYIKLNGKTYYYDFRPKDFKNESLMSYISGLDFLTKKFIPQKSLLSLASTLNSIIPIDIGVSSEFELFLKDNRNELIKNDELINHFLKGDEIVTRHETFNRINYKQIIEQYLKGPFKNSDFEYEKDGLNANQSDQNNYRANCNYDLKKETTLRDDLMNTNLKKSHYIALSEGDNIFLAVSSSTLLKPLKTISKMGYFMKSSPATSPLPICEFKGENQEIILFSSEGRNPIQHLQHLQAYEIQQVDSAQSLNELLGFSRHLFLSNPDRILYESKRGRKAQLDFFLEMNFPIYHVDNLGNIFGHAVFKNNKQKQSALFSDIRSTARLWCKE